MENWKEQVSEWKEELLRSSNNDILLDISGSTKVFSLPESNNNTWVIPFNSIINRIIKDQITHEKQAGINTLCSVHQVLIWSDGQREYKTPLVLSEASFTNNKIKKEITLNDSETTFINPFLVKKLKNLFNFSLEEPLENIDFPKEWEVKTEYIVGNFHYHRFSLLKDVEEYSNREDADSSLIGTFFHGNKLIKQDEVDELNTKNYLFPMDEFQRNVFSSVSSGENCVVEGPPGSGKSQLIVNLLFQHAMNGKQVVLCSEKLAALQIIQEKFNTKGLAHYCQAIFNETQDKSTIIQSLKTTWAKIEEELEPENKTHVLFFERYSILEQKLRRLAHLPKLTNCTTLPSFTLPYYPNEKKWNSCSTFVNEIQLNYREQFAKSFNHSAVFSIVPIHFKETTTLTRFFSELPQLCLELNTLSNLFDTSIELRTINDWKLLNRQAIHAQLLSHELYKRTNKLFNGSATIVKNYQKQTKLYQKLTLSIEAISRTEISKWKQLWSESEINQALFVFSNSKWWSLHYRKWKSKFMMDYAPSIFSRDLAKNALSTKKSYYQKTKNLAEVKGKLHDLGIQHPESEIHLIDTLISKHNTIEPAILKTLHSYSAEDLDRLISNSNKITQINRFISTNLRVSDNDSVLSICIQLQEEADFILSNRNTLLNIIELDSTFFTTLKHVQNWEELPSVIEYGQLIQFKQLNSSLFHYSSSDFNLDLETLINEEFTFCEEQAQLFHSKIKKQFNDYHQLLSIPAAALDSEQKQQKAELRKGRSILIKEFNKKRQHLSLRELLDSPAKHWVYLLKPILLITPWSFSKLIPNQKGIIDLLILDEASQIPFVHALPAIYRSRQVCIVGDSMQMAPSSYFISGNREREDVLSIAKYHFKTHILRYHYRSQNAELIAFSNRYFYNNELRVFPNSKQDFPSGVHTYYVNDGRFIAQQNEEEARALVNWLVKNVEVFNSADTIGIVAFSATQLACIQMIFQETNHSHLLQLYENGQLFFSTLENIQGDECDQLLISFGYGRDENNQFSLRFGPINQLGGEKRLNVLFSRARKGMHFFHSIVYQDFPPSENLGVEMLRNFFRHATSEKSDSQSFSQKDLENWGLDMQADLTSNTLHINNPYHSVHALEKCLLIKQLAKARNWNVSFSFAKDMFC